MALSPLLDAVERLPSFVRLLNTMPAPTERRTISGLPGSADASILAALARRLPTRFFVVATESVTEAERWLADLGTLVDETPVALYPPREGFGEAEPHMEVAGERVETLERLTRGEIHVLITTARALLERTRMPRALRELRVELRKGDMHRLERLASHLESIGFERVAMVEDVAQFSVRGGIFDVYSFGMPEPVRAEFWGDEIVDLRYFDINTQRSTRVVDLALILPVDGHVRDDAITAERLSITNLFPPDTILYLPRGSHIDPELKRTWTDAQHHIDLARRRGQDTVSRDELFVPPDDATRALRAFGAIGSIAEGEDEPEIVFPLRPPEVIDRDIRQLKRLVRDDLTTIILCDNEGQCERLDELLNDGEYAPSPAHLSIGVLDGGFIVPPRDSQRGLRILTDHEIVRRERRIR